MVHCPRAVVGKEGRSSKVSEQRAVTAKEWPFEEARRIIRRLEKYHPKKGYVLFETGYGPSGLPHMGTFGEVVRTTFVRRAFSELNQTPTRLICFSDDMDALRKVPPPTFVNNK